MAEEKHELNPATDLICEECGKQIVANQDFNTNEDGTVVHADEDECEK